MVVPPLNFVRGLKSKLASALAAHCSLATMQELDSVISAAEEMEAKLNLAAKQDQPSLAAIAAPQRGGSGAARKARGGAAGGRTPYSRGGGNVGRVNNAGRGNNGAARYNSAKCGHCHIAGHSIRDCRKLQALFAETPKPVAEPANCEK